jgi:transcriptional regulator with XRE-family HTH domain
MKRRGAGRPASPPQSWEPVVNRLLEMAADQGYSQTHLALVLGLQVTTVNDWWRGKKLPPLAQVMRLAKEVGAEIIVKEKE